ncbi:MAG: hypothetical protein R3C28_17465 [Pirellulaceae bacterium]
MLFLKQTWYDAAQLGVVHQSDVSLHHLRSIFAQFLLEHITVDPDFNCFAMRRMRR